LRPPIEVGFLGNLVPSFLGGTSGLRRDSTCPVTAVDSTGRCNTRSTATRRESKGWNRLIQTKRCPVWPGSTVAGSTEEVSWDQSIGGCCVDRLSRQRLSGVRRRPTSVHPSVSPAREGRFDTLVSCGHPVLDCWTDRSGESVGGSSGRASRGAHGQVY
jgi:hypothetical protein